MYKKKKILAIVLARSGSKTIKNKNIVKVNNTPLVGLVGKVIGKTKIIDEAIVSTDSDKIGKISKRYGLNYSFKRPKKLSGDIVSDFKVLEHALKKMEKIKKIKFDIVISLPPTSPLRSKKFIEQGVYKLISNKYDSLWTISKTDTKFHPEKQLVIKKNKLTYYHKNGSNIIARQQLSKIYHRNGVAYIMTRNCILKKKTLLTKNSGYLIIAEKQISIDTMEDLKTVKKLI